MTTKLSVSAISDYDLHPLFVEHLSAINSKADSRSDTELRALWQDICEHYSASERAYHNLDHLRQLFTQFETIENDLKQPAIIALALFYHDVIYDPKRSDNELKSAEYAVSKLSPYLSHEQCLRVYELIMMTAKHQLYDENDSDGAYLLDMDLSVLGGDKSEYEHYAKAVRQEYSHVVQSDYRAGRTAVLKGLLAHPRLYLTDYYYQRLESQARENIEREIALLLG